MKRNIIRIAVLMTFIILMLILSSCLVFCAGCTTLSCSSCGSCGNGSSGALKNIPAVFINSSSVQENDKYMLINNDWLIDKEKNQMFIESYKYEHSGFDYTGNNYGAELTENGFMQYGIRRVPKYNVNTGLVDHYEYYKITFILDNEANELDMKQDTQLLTEEQVNELTKKVDSDRYSGFTISSDPHHYYDDEDEYDVESMHEVDRAIYEYAYTTTGIGVDAGDFYQTNVKIKNLNGIMYFTIYYCNKNQFWSTRADFRGVHGSSLCYYNEVNKKIEVVHTFEDEEVIIYFDESCVMTLNTNHQVHIYDTEKYEKKLVGKVANTNDCYIAVLPVKNSIIIEVEGDIEIDNKDYNRYIYISNTGEIIFDQQIKY
ncbi:MAG: hypothetical protein II984_11330 [Clostridia bacterium]|nr:hypothetical protein [Clostridia bacterium]